MKIKQQQRLEDDEKEFKRQQVCCSHSMVVLGSILTSFLLDLKAAAVAQAAAEKEAAQKLAEAHRVRQSAVQCVSFERQRSCS